MAGASSASGGAAARRPSDAHEIGCRGGVVWQSAHDRRGTSGCPATWLDTSSVSASAETTSGGSNRSAVVPRRTRSGCSIGSSTASATKSASDRSSRSLPESQTIGLTEPPSSNSPRTSRRDTSSEPAARRTVEQRIATLLDGRALSEHVTALLEDHGKDAKAGLASDLVGLDGFLAAGSAAIDLAAVQLGGGWVKLPGSTQRPRSVPVNFPQAHWCFQAVPRSTNSIVDWHASQRTEDVPVRPNSSHASRKTSRSACVSERRSTRPGRSGSRCISSRIRH